MHIFRSQSLQLGSAPSAAARACLAHMPLFSCHWPPHPSRSPLRVLASGRGQTARALLASARMRISERSAIPAHIYASACTAAALAAGMRRGGQFRPHPPAGCAADGRRGRNGGRYLPLKGQGPLNSFHMHTSSACIENPAWGALMSRAHGPGAFWSP